LALEEELGKFIIIFVLALLLIPLAIILIRFNRKRVHIIRQAASATDDQLERVYRSIESKNTESPTCGVLTRTNRTAPSSSANIPIPEYVQPWAWKTIIVANADIVEFSLSDATTIEPAIAGKVFRILAVPRKPTKTGKSRNQFSPKSYVAGNPDLMDALRTICPRYPEELLSYLLSAGIDSFEFDPIHQARVGGSPAWIQNAEFQNCDQCKKRMVLLLQLPGSLVPGMANARAWFYLFGCVKHPKETKMVVQYD
jgi:hypothetical protein